jgi:hypothetical protein
MPPSLPIFLAVAAAFWGASVFIGRRGGVRDLPGSWTIVLVAMMAALRSLYEDRLPLGDWSADALCLALFAVPYLSLQWFYSRRQRRQAHAPEADAETRREG